MIYIGTPSTPGVRAAMTAGRIACITTPGQGNRIPEAARYACDNGRYGAGWPGEDKWWAWLSKRVAEYGAERCLFAVAPDVVGDGAATLVESRPWLPRIRQLGVPAAFVAQDGCTTAGIPWGEFDVLFLGGTDEFKLGPEAAAVAAQARERGVPVHMGRVNTRKRLRIAYRLGCGSVDGTYFAFGPDKNLARMTRWMGELAAWHSAPPKTGRALAARNRHEQGGLWD